MKQNANDAAALFFHLEARVVICALIGVAVGALVVAILAMIADAVTYADAQRAKATVARFDRRRR